MKPQYVWACAVALAATFTSPVESGAQTNGVILICTRKNQDTAISTEHVTETKGPGQATPGDVAMATLLADHGYSSRLILDLMLHSSGAAYGWNRDSYLQPPDANAPIALLIVSGSSASADVPTPPPNIPVMMGEHVTLGDRTEREGSLFLYTGTSSSDPNQGNWTNKYMKVVAPDHPIMRGIPLDAQGRVKIFRERYPDEELHVPPGGKVNYEWRWCTQVAANAAPATTVLGVLDGAEDRACFAVAEVDGLLAFNPNLGYAELNAARKVHLFVNENGSGGSRRVFLALTELGRVLFVRAAKWAMGEELEPYQPLGVIDVTPAGGQRIKVSWQGSARKNYRIVGSTDLMKPLPWQAMVEDIPGHDGEVARTLDISAGPRALFMQVQALP